MSSKNKKSVDVPEQPKRPLSSYFIYLGEQRAVLKQKYPDLKPTEVATKVSELYKALDEKERKKYEDKARDAKAIYEEELKKFLSKGGEIPKKKRDNGKEESQGKKPKKSPGSKVEETKEAPQKGKEKKAPPKEEKKAETKPAKKK